VTQVGTVESLWRYPAKSMMGDRFAALPVNDRGIFGDRGWAVRDEARGGIRGAKKIGGLMRLHARYLEEPGEELPPPPIEIRFPDGGTVRSTDPDVNDRLSKVLDQPVTLWPLQPPAALEHYRRGAPDYEDMEKELRSIFGREQDEPLPSFEGLPLDVLVEYESPPGTYFDAFPLLLVTDRSLATLSRLEPAAEFDVRRFRPNIVVTVGDDDGADFPERDWIGRRLRIGEVELELTAACPRCVMVTRGFADVAEDRRVLRTIVREADQNVGVYATVVNRGMLTTHTPAHLI
jgi:uncharacterized protein